MRFERENNIRIYPEHIMSDGTTYEHENSSTFYVSSQYLLSQVH